MSTPSPATGVEKVFKRHSRPQLPVVPSPSRRPLTIGSRSEPSWKSSHVRAVKQKAREPAQPGKLEEVHEEIREEIREDAVERAVEESEWVSFIRLGTLIQGSSELIICHRRDAGTALYMFREIEHDTLVKRALNLRHSSLATPKFSIDSAAGRYLGFEYLRFSLQELVKTAMRMEERHLQTVVRSVSEPSARTRGITDIRL